MSVRAAVEWFAEDSAATTRAPLTPKAALKTRTFEMAKSERHDQAGNPRIRQQLSSLGGRSADEGPPHPKSPIVDDVSGSRGRRSSTADRHRSGDASGRSGPTIYGEDAGDFSGWTSRNAGDFNGDGFDDMLIGSGTSDGLNNFVTKCWRRVRRVRWWSNIPATVDLGNLGSAGSHPWGRPKRIGSGILEMEQLRRYQR